MRAKVAIRRIKSYAIIAGNTINKGVQAIYESMRAKASLKFF